MPRELTTHLLPVNPASKTEIRHRWRWEKAFLPCIAKRIPNPSIIIVSKF
jgi:hypothetical protein